MTTRELRHPFETFGPAPYVIVKVEEKVHVIPGVMVRAGGSCDVCGTCIRWAYTVRADNGVEFVTGCDCAEKCGMTARELRDARRSYLSAEARKAHREERLAREAAERSGNPYGLTARELNEAEAVGREAANAWLRAERLVEAAHVGTVGKRIKGLELRVDHSAHWDGNYGPMSLYIMRDRAGNCFTWKTSGCLGFSDEQGHWRRVTEIDSRDHKTRRSGWFTCDATVKGHGSYKGLRQTELTRVKVKSAGKMTPVGETRTLRCDAA